METRVHVRIIAAAGNVGQRGLQFKTPSGSRSRLPSSFHCKLIAANETNGILRRFGDKH